VTGYRGVGKTSFVNQVIRQLHERRAWSNTSGSRSMLASMIPSARGASLSSRLQTVRAASLALVAVVLLNLMWDGSIPATKLGLVDFGPFSLAAVRLLPAGALFVRVLSPAASRRLPSADRLHKAGLGV